ncbi:alpha/beta fold hydrolase [Aquimarina litoralis]|nr:alpha/beta fold hydrolase [Aquimarina litoralis]
MKNQVLLLLVISFVYTIAGAQTEVTLENGIKGERSFLKMDWGKMNYEVFGEGEPLLILHGNGGSAAGRYSMIPKLIKHHQVIAVDARCHGRSSCPEGDLDYFDMVDDVITLMKKLKHEKYSIWGHSDGGILGLIIGYKFTHKLNRMVLSGANARFSGLKPELQAFVKKYDQVPDPKMRKQVALMAHQKEISMDSIRKINVPVLLMVGDRDAIRMKHTMEIFEALPMANLCVLPASSHFITNEKPNHIIYWIKEFKKPFSAPSTVEIAKKMAKSIFEGN